MRGISRGSGIGIALTATLFIATAVAQDDSGAASPCDVSAPCQVSDGRYLAHQPSGWDGVTPLPAALYFHGWNATANAVLNNRGLVEAFDRLGILLIVPDGRDKTWAHVGSPSQARDELPFIDAVLTDARRRWPIDSAKLWATGFSQGASMVWDLICYRADRFAAFAPIAGAFWRPLPSDCPSGPAHVRHIHGFSDTVVPIEGRPIGTYHQGNVFAALLMRRNRNGCPSAPTRYDTEGDSSDAVQCRIWDGCSSGRELRFCLHSGGHKSPQGWVESAWRWVQSVIE